MKKVIILCICIFLLSACAAFGNNAGNDKLNTVTDSVVTGSSLTGSAVTGSAVSAGATTEKVEKKGKKKISYVIDETGARRKLELGEINTKDAGIGISDFDLTPCIGNYSQVSDGHYYYMKSDGKHNYTIYRDKGDRIGRFSVDVDPDASWNSLQDFAKYGSEYYAILRYEYKKGDTSSPDVKTYLAHVDLKKGKAEPVVNLTGRSLGILYLYRQGVYFEDKDWDNDDDDYDWSDDEDDEDDWIEVDEGDLDTGDFVKMDTERDFSETILSPTSNMSMELSSLTFMDGKIYYSVQRGKKVALYSYDMESQQEEEILFYERKKAYEYDYLESLKIDEDYIYCQDYIIPRDGGEMIPFFRRVKEYDLNLRAVLPYTYNKKYIFYVDKKYKVHRFTKKTKKDVIISNIKAMDVKCTEDSVYVQEYDKFSIEGGPEYVHSDDNPASSNVYCMDVNGKNVKKIVERVAPKKNPEW